MSDLRDLLERAVPRETAPAVLASEIRALGRRRQRRGRLIGAAVSTAAVVASVGLVVQFVRGAPAPAGPAVGATSRPSSPSASPDPTGPEFTGLVGTRWVLDLVSTGVSAAQAYPGEPGAYPRALVTFGADHRLSLFFSAGGRTTTVLGTWTATSTTPVPTPDSRGSIRIAMDAPPGVSGTLASLLAHLDMTTDFAMARRTDPVPYLSPLTMVAYRYAVVSLELDQVRPSAHLPAPYPGGP